MKTTIEVKDRREGELIRSALDNPEARALIIILGALQPLDVSVQARIMDYVGNFYGADK
jgi:hypothetical protein